MQLPSIYQGVKPENINDILAAGEWGSNAPSGVTIHYSADSNVERVISWLKSNNLGYHLLIDRDGTLIQTCSFKKRVNHAGNSRWRNLRTNNYHIAICLISWGCLSVFDDKFYTWSSKCIPPEYVVMRPNHLGNIKPWNKATVEQEAILQSTLAWLIDCGLYPENICGHDESCLPLGEKQDPGGILSVAVSDIRQFFKERTV